MPAPEINLLPQTRPDHTRLEVVLDLEPSDFRIAHVRELCGSLARFAGLAGHRLSVVSITRWQPIVLLDLPQDGATEILEAFTSSSERLQGALGKLPVLSMRLDTEATVTPAPPPSEERAGFELSTLIELAYRLGKALALGIVGCAAILLGAIPTLILGGASAASKVWRRAGGRPIELPPWLGGTSRSLLNRAHDQAALCVADLKKLMDLGVRIPLDGFGPAREEIWTGEFRQAVEIRRIEAWNFRDWRIVMLNLGRLLVVLVVACLRVLHGLAEDWVRDFDREGVVLAEQSRLWWHRKRPTLRRAWAHRDFGLIFDDRNDLLFLAVLLTIVLYILFIWWRWS